MSQLESNKRDISQDAIALKEFFTSNNLENLFPSFLNANYTIDLLEVCEESDIRDLCKELNVSVQQRLMLIKAVRNLQSAKNKKNNNNGNYNTPTLSTEQLEKLRILYDRFDKISKTIGM